MKRTLIAAVIAGLTLIQNSYALKFIAYGDSRTNASTHKSIVAKYATENPELVIHSGDLWDDYTSSEWKSHFTSVPAMNTLLTNNKILVARGNHETESEVKNFTPSIIKNSSLTYAFREGNCFFVSMGYDPGANNTWLETQLKSTESQTADWRFIYAHKPVYSTGSHGADGNTSEGSSVTNFRKLCDTYKVTMFFAGHDHLYERTHWICEGKSVSEATSINITDKPGTFYFVVGGGGAPLYSTGSGWWVNVNEKVYHYCVLDAKPDSLKCTAKNSSGTVIDAVTIFKTGAAISLNNPLLAKVSLQIIGNRLMYKLPVNSSGKNTKLSIKLYDLKGALIRTLLDGMQDAGAHFMDINLTAGSKPLSSGLYLCRLEAENMNETITFMLK